MYYFVDYFLMLTVMPLRLSAITLLQRTGTENILESSVGHIIDNNNKEKKLESSDIAWGAEDSITLRRNALLNS
jgi:hypothetical protein